MNCMFVCVQELEAVTGQRGCAFCGGLGHRVTDCPKLANQSKEEMRGKKDYFGAGGFGGEM
jgi:ATP-dependent RNA helicase DDX41